MTRHLSDREDLLVEGVNLPERGRVTDAKSNRQWIIGWRNHTAASLFDGVDPVFQFNTLGQLRRVFLDDQKMAAQSGRLTRLARRRDSAGRMTHERHVLSSEEGERVLQRLSHCTTALEQTLVGGEAQIETIGITPEGFTERLRSWLGNMNCIEIAHGPGVVG